MLYELKELDDARTEFDEIIADFAKQSPQAVGRSYEKLAWIEYRAGDFELALRRADAAVDLLPDDPQTLNARAYLCSLTGLRLDRGMVDVEMAIQNQRQVDEERAKRSRRRPAIEDYPGFVDTRAYLHFKKGELRAALADMNRALPPVLAEYRRAEMRDFSGDGHGTPEMREHAKQQMRQNLGVMYHHRHEIHQALGNVEEADADRLKADEYGYDPQGSVF
ncbi:MAG: hypothetical protein QM811_23570 [Pirellulales bacterium]